MTRSLRLWTVLAFNVLLVGALVGVGLAAHSVGVWAEGADYLADAAAIGVSLVAIDFESRPPTVRRPHGYPRASRFAALVNAGWLFVLCALVTADALERLVVGVQHVHGLPVLVVSGVAALVMLAGALLLGGEDGEEDLNVRAVLLDTAADAAAAAGVAIAGGVIYANHGTYWLDPAVALAVAVVVGFQAARLLGRIKTSLGEGTARSNSWNSVGLNLGTRTSSTEEHLAYAHRLPLGPVGSLQHQFAYHAQGGETPELEISRDAWAAIGSNGSATIELSQDIATPETKANLPAATGRSVKSTIHPSETRK